MSEKESITRTTRIDPKLNASGWSVVPFHQASSASPKHAAVEEFETDLGPADYVLSDEGQLLGVVEAKKLTANLARRSVVENQVKIYEAANQTRSSVKVIVCFTAKDVARVKKILAELKLQKEESVVVIDACSDNKPSASKA
jgi:type I site-specific restriction endonuclease